VICLNVKNCLVAAVLSAIVLALAFIPLSGSQTAMPYDPWADINDDGYIDGKDVSYTARLFGSTGDPTKNVNVTNWPTQQPEPSWKVEVLNVNVSLYKNVENPTWSTIIYSGGYSRAIVYFSVSEFSGSIYNAYWYIYLWGVGWTTSPSITVPTMGYTQLSKDTLKWTHDPITHTSTSPEAAYEFKTMGPYCSFCLVGNVTGADGWAEVNVSVYLRNE